MGVSDPRWGEWAHEVDITQQPTWPLFLESTFCTRGVPLLSGLGAGLMREPGFLVFPLSVVL